MQPPFHRRPAVPPHLRLRRRPIRGPRPRPLLRGCPATSLRLRRNPLHVRLRPTGPLHLSQSLPCSHEGLQPRQHPRIRVASAGLRGVRPLVLIDPRADSAQSALRLFRHLPRRNPPRQAQSAHGVPAKDHLRLDPRRGIRLRDLLQEHTHHSILQEFAQVEVRFQIPFVLDV